MEIERERETGNKRRSERIKLKIEERERGGGKKADKANSRGKRGGESERGCLVHHAHRINFQSDKF